MENNTPIIQINVATLTQQVESGMKKKALAKHYGISELQMTKALQQAGLTIRKFHHPKFELVTETAEKAEEVAAQDDQPETIQEDRAEEAPVDKVESEEEVKPTDDNEAQPTQSAW